MAIYHFSVQMIQRSVGRSSVASAAYRAGENLYDERTGLEHNYTKKTGVEYKEILTPPNAPKWCCNREKLWNEVERTEKRKDAQVAREINIALPKELNKEQQINLLKNYVQDNFVDKGMIADVCIHGLENNPHAHVMLTTRRINLEGFENKNREWNKKETLEIWREQWATYANKELEKSGYTEKIDNRTLKNQEIDRIPQIHIGVHASAMQKKGINTERGNLNNEIQEFNKTKIVELEKYRALKKELEKEKETQKSKYGHLSSDEKVCVKHAETILKTKPTIKNLGEEIDSTKTQKQNLERKISDLNRETKYTEYSIGEIKNILEFKEKLENEIKDKSQGLGKLTNRKDITILKDKIHRKNQNLIHLGIEKQEDYEGKINQLGEMRKQTQTMRQAYDRLNNRLKTLQEAHRALKNGLTRVYIGQYEKEFSQAKYWSYSDIKPIDDINQMYGKVIPLEQINVEYENTYTQIKELNKQLDSIKSNGERLKSCEYTLKNYGEYKFRVEELNKPLNKVKRAFDKKLQSEYTGVSNNMNKSLESVQKNYKVKDNSDLEIQAKEHYQILRDIKPKLDDKVTSLTSKFNLLGRVIQSMNTAMYKEKSIEIERSLTKTKYKNKSFEMER